MRVRIPIATFDQLVPERTHAEVAAQDMEACKDQCLAVANPPLPIGHRYIVIIALRTN